MPIVLGAIVLMSIATPMVAQASCVAPPPLATAIARASTVFVGTVSDVGYGGRVATVQVDDVWKGAVLKSEVEVVGTPELGAGATSVDRTYVVGQQYLFVPFSGDGDRFQDNACTMTQPYSESLASFRPVGAPGAPDDSGSDRPAFLIAGGMLLLISAGGLVLAWYRRRHRTALVES